jgi:cation diffusion facilitator family transporter
MEHRQQNKTAFIRSAAITALTGNVILAVLKICAGIFANSSALIGDGIDSSADVLICVVTLAVVRIISRPADAGHPWGHGRAETVATAFLSFTLFFVGAQLIFSSTSKLLIGAEQPAPSGIAIIITLVSIVGKIILAYSQYLFGKKADSLMIKANAKNMASDVLISVGVLIGLAIATFTDSGLADTIIAIIIGVLIIKTAIGIFLEVTLELMDGSNGTESYRLIFDAVSAVEGASNPHRARMRRVAGFWDIDLDIEVDPALSVADAHSIASRVEDEIKLRLENVLDIMVHIEPSGDRAREKFGLSESQTNP